MSLLDDFGEMVSGRGDIAGVRITAWYRPVGGPAAKVSPPRYLTGDRQKPYIEERRYGPDGELVPVVLIDSVQAQANRVEEALLRLAEGGRIELPYLELATEVDGWYVRLSSLDAPHRSRDAYFRDSLLGGQDFEATEVGRALRRAEPRSMRPYFEHSPTDLVLGFWDSQRGGRQTRLARSYLSETIGWGPEQGTRGAGRFDPLVNMGADASRVKKDAAGWELDEKGKTKLSEINLGMVPPAPAPGGVSVKAIQRVAYLNGVSLSRLGFAVSADASPDEPTDLAGRTTLAALALVGDRAAFAGPGVFLRSGCDLVLEREELAFVRRGGEETSLDLGLDEAIDLFVSALAGARAAGLAWRGGALRLEPKAGLRELIEMAYLRAPAEES
jgi:CRISPR-associated protein Csb1